MMNVLAIGCVRRTNILRGYTSSIGSSIGSNSSSMGHFGIMRGFASDNTTSGGRSYNNSGGSTTTTGGGGRGGGGGGGKHKDKPKFKFGQRKVVESKKSEKISFGKESIVVSGSTSNSTSKTSSTYYGSKDRSKAQVSNAKNAGGSATGGTDDGKLGTFLRPDRIYASDFLVESEEDEEDEDDWILELDQKLTKYQRKKLLKAQLAEEEFNGTPAGGEDIKFRRSNEEDGDENTSSGDVDDDEEKEIRIEDFYDTSGDVAVDNFDEHGTPMWLVSARKMVAETETKKSKNSGMKQVGEERFVNIDAFGRAYGTGRRKTSTSRVWISTSNCDGKIMVNGIDMADYFYRTDQMLEILKPFLVLEVLGQFDVKCTVKGGGLSGQAGAIRHGISRALQAWDPTFRPALKEEKLLRRDPRMVERKKAGQPKARKKFQWVRR